ncbi:methyltransferase domain-containing protein [Candidatus Pelagibacter sp.]|uniref:methyltransferase domain-containing protein n=1 Tax=Candidatus Pelagibacter sp. TaxID=2024849 RepID=UPI003F8488DF
MSSLKFFFDIIYGIYRNKSLCRILQNIECKKNKISGNIIEFGAEPLSKNSFVSLAKKIRVKKIDFSDKYIKKVGVINADLNKKTSLKKNKYNNVLLFNVLEHLTEINNAKKEIKKILKNKGVLIGSTPFLYRFHGAPSDYLRFTKPFLILFFEKDFKIIEVKNLGFGPFSLCFSLISDFSKKIPFLNIIIFPIAFLLDTILNLFVNYDLKDIYPIAVFFKVQKK